MTDRIGVGSAAGVWNADMRVHGSKIWQMFRSIPALLFILYIGFGALEVVDSTLSRMHLPGGASASGSTIASPTSVSSGASGTAAAEAIEQWNRWSDIYTRGTWTSEVGTGQPLTTVLMLYGVIDVLLISLPLFFILKRINTRATARLGRFQDRMTEIRERVSDPTASAAAAVSLSRVEDLAGLLKVSFIATVIYLVLDIAEDALLLGAAHTQHGWLIAATGGASLLKWVALGSAAIGLVVGLIGSRDMRSDSKVGIRFSVARAISKRAYLLALRIQIGVALLLLVLGGMRGDLGHQLDDAFLITFGRGGQLAIWTAFVAGIVLVTMLITANLCLRVYLKDTESAPVRPATWKVRVTLITGFVLVVLGGLAVFLKMPFGVALIAPGLLGLVIGFYSRFASADTKPDVFTTNRIRNVTIGWPWSVALAVVPLVVLTALAVRNGVRLLTIHEYRYGLPLVFGFPLGAIAAGVMFTLATYWLLRKFGRIADRTREVARRRDGHPVDWSAAVVGGLAVLVMVAMAVDPQWSGTEVGPWGVVFVFCMFIALAGTGLVILGDKIRAWGVIAAVGFRRTPWIALVMVCFAVTSAFDNKYIYHDARTGNRLDTSDYANLRGISSESGYQLALADALDQWSEEQLAIDGDRKEIPIVFVASAGGGIRAAYWTALVLQCLMDGTTPYNEGGRGGDGAACSKPVLPKESIFLASGISGGSLGLAGLHGVDREIWVNSLREDFLGPTLAALTFRDVPNSFLRLGVHDADRATVLERAWEDAAGGEGSGLDRGLMKSAFKRDGTGTGAVAFPLLMLNGTSVSDGCRVTASVLDLSTASRSSGESSSTGCLALNEKRFAEPGALPVLPATKDVFDNTCAHGGGEVPYDIRLSTAALLSARFPYVSPTGALNSCTKTGEQTYDLDGGLIDTSAALPLALMWPEIVRWLNESSRTVCFAPKLIIMENGYVEQTKSDPPSHPSELVAPLSATMAAQAAVSPTARQAAALAFQKSFEGAGCAPDNAEGQDWIMPSVVDFYPVSQPGVQAPLGWTLSYYSQDSLEGQVVSEDNECQAAIVAAWFDGTTSRPSMCPVHDSGGR